MLALENCCEFSSWIGLLHLALTPVTTFAISINTKKENKRMHPTHMTMSILCQNGPIGSFPGSRGPAKEPTYSKALNPLGLEFKNFLSHIKCLLNPIWTSSAFWQCSMSLCLSSAMFFKLPVCLFNAGSHDHSMIHEVSPNSCQTFDITKLCFFPSPPHSFHMRFTSQFWTRI